ncbi:unnamed protein product [Durusdinium trenchii]|uniref:RNA-editing substrate-binding complex 6 protein domain-containing protein n=2 Tax=Durusdinium trenchii TaxID=1381693 RepID=A0ABP0J6N9_9DINO
MARIALTELRLQTFKRVYRLDASELCGVFREAAERRINNREVWDALLYRATLLRGEFRPKDLATTVDSLARIRYKDSSVLDYLLQEVRSKARQFRVRDAALLLNGLAKFGLRDELLCRSLLPPLLRRITEKSKWEDLSLLALSYARLSDPGREPIFDQIVGSLTPRLNRIDDGHTLSLLACAFTRATARNPHVEEESAEESYVETEGPAVRKEREDESAPALFQLEAGEFSHISFVELLLEQCERHIFSFRGSDVVHLCLALATLVRSGHAELIPPRLLKHLAKRLDALYFDLVPGQFVRLLELIQYLPEVEVACGPRILDELAYRARELFPRSCLPMLRAALRLNHARGKSAAAWRLTRMDATAGGPSILTNSETCEAAAMLAEAAMPGTSMSSGFAFDQGETSGSLLWEAREALLILLHGLKKRGVDLKPEMAANLLRFAAALSVRDTHWFYLGQKLLVPQPMHGKHSTRSSSTIASETVTEADLATCTLALARLSFPQLVDAGSLFSRSAVAVKSPEAASSVMEAAAIFSLTERRPQDLVASKLIPLVTVLDKALRTLPKDDQYETKAAALLPRLFPFCGRFAQVAGQEAILEWRPLIITSTTMAVAARSRSSRFQELVLQELSTWPGIDLETEITVGPISVPFAMNLVGLANFVRHQHGYVDLGDESESSGEEGLAMPEARTVHSRRLGRRKRKAARAKQPPLAPKPQDVDFADDEALLRSTPSNARPETHVLLELLRDSDYYHASPTLQGERQRAKGLLLAAEKHAEIQLLRQMGWHVICVPEHRWQMEDPKGFQANREMIFKLVADLTGEVR